MAKTIIRKLLKQFGVNGDPTNYAEFGSQVAGSPVKTKDILTIQSLSAWLNGLQDAVVAGNHAPYLEDFNSLFYVLAYQVAYLLQDGIPEWDATTTYFNGSTVRNPGTGDVYQSIIDDNLNNALPNRVDNGSWYFMSPVRFSSLLGSISAGQIPNSIITDAMIVAMAASKLTGTITPSDGTVTNAKLGALAVTDGKVNDVNGSKITGTIGTTQIANGAVTNLKINDVDGSKITGNVPASIITGILPVLNGGTGRSNQLIVTGAYTGNGVGGRNIAHGFGTAPDIVIIFPVAANLIPSYNTIGQANTGAMYFYNLGGPNPNTLFAFDATNITLTTNSSVNANGVSYLFVALKSQ
jgi:hypothetical protein